MMKVLNLIQFKLDASQPCWQEKPHEYLKANSSKKEVGDLSEKKIKE